MTTTIDRPKPTAPSPEPESCVSRILIRFGTMLKTLIPTHKMRIEYGDHLSVETDLPAERSAEIRFESPGRTNVTARRNWMQYDLANALVGVVRNYVNLTGLLDECLFVDVTEWIESTDSDACLFVRDQTLHDDIELTCQLVPYHGVPVMRTPEGRYVAQYRVKARLL